MGRFFEIIGIRPKLAKGNAENMCNGKDGYKRGQTPKLGVVACWRKGKAGNEKDGAGHVGIVEKITKTKVTMSMSDYGGSRFYTRTFNIGKYSLGSTYVFQGFIYPPIDLELEPTPVPTPTPKPTTATLKKGDKVQIKKSGKERADGKVRQPMG